MGSEDGWTDVEGDALGKVDGIPDEEGFEDGWAYGAAESDGLKLGSEDGWTDVEGEALGSKVGT